ncbi:hypothetical protein XELAEV_18023453mg [Xenopus laevis]|uniref:Helix-turn-helix domain-containing protein n=1 Tax=Xenopus laevis TaxID=8355 RepID=A0A974D532_XENLA|nr:hypothetical protein XELAEV_18023453mg [Xenopus laevis]
MNESIHFHIVLIYRGKDGRLFTLVFSKPADRNQILHFRSQHPPHTKNAILVSQLSRVKRLISNTKEQGIQEHKICQKFRDRGSPETVIHKAQYRVNHPSEKKAQSGRIPFVIQISFNSESIGKILCKHWYILRNAYPIIQEFKSLPLVSYRRGKTIGTLVTSSNLKIKVKTTNTFLESKSTGMYPCLCCNQCPYVLKRKEFVHPQTGQRVQRQGYYTCIIKFAIYVLTCSCDLFYIGETIQMVKSRISQHRSSINLGNVWDAPNPGFGLGFSLFQQIRTIPSVQPNRIFKRQISVPPLKRGGNRELKLKKREV